jgi:hypothetical protein
MGVVMNRYLAIFIFVNFGIIFMVAGFNYEVDSAGLFHVGFEQKAAGLIVAGENIFVTQNLNERRLQREVIGALTVTPATIVLGSSRVMSLTASDVGSDSFRNNWMSGASLEDYLAVIGMYEKTIGLPKILIIGVDPWIFNRDNGQTRWMELRKDVDRFLKIMEGTTLDENEDTNNKLQAIFSLQYAQENFKRWCKGESEIILADGKSIIIDGDVINSDGSRVCSPEIQNIHGAEIERLARKYCRDPMYSLGNYDQLDSVAVGRFNTLLKYLEEEERTVIILLPPYHPIVYKKLATDERYKVVLQVEEMMHQVNGVSVIGSYNPAICGYVNEDFRDGMHPKSLRKLMLKYQAIWN